MSAVSCKPSTHEEGLSIATMALWNLQGVFNLIREEQTVAQASFPQHIASAIRMMEYQVGGALREIEHLL